MIISSQDYYHDLLSGLRAAIPAIVKLFYSDSQLVRWKSGHGFSVYKTCIWRLMPAQEWHRTSSAHVGTLSPFTTQSCSHLTSYFCTFTVFVESNIFQYVLFFPSGTFFFYNVFALIAFYIFFKKSLLF